MIITGPEIVSWAAKRLPVSFGEAQGIGVGRRGRIVGAAIFHDYRPRYGSIQISAVSEGQWLTKEVMGVIFHYPFVQLGCTSIYACVEAHNTHSQRFTEKAGFKPAGLLRRGFGTADAVLYDMLAEDCKWIRSSHERHAIRAACA